jgi:NRPS condensation-like uncharacterized protein
MNRNDVIEYVRAEKDAKSATIWKFSTLDRACLSMVIRGTWIFDKQLDADKMKAGLRKLLNYYPHLSGRMKDKTGIHLTNEGVPFTVAEEPDLSVADVHKMDDLIKHFSTEIKISEIKRGNEAPMSVKVTKLRNGYVLGIQCFHACMDGNSFYTMAYNWGKICKKQDFEKPVLDQSLFPVPKDLSRKQAMEYAIDFGWEKYLYCLLS